MLWLVTPVHGREELTRLCFEQRARMLAELAELGVPARQVVVGDDANLATAREFGFETLRRRNVVGFRVNEGFEWACREGGATSVAYCGSDDWNLASYFVEPPAPGTVKTCRWQAFVAPDGGRLVTIRQTAAAGGGPWIVSRAALEQAGFRPADSKAMRAVDASIARGLAPQGTRWNEPRPRFTAEFVFDEEAHPLRLVDFKGGGEQITPWARVVVRQRALELDSARPFEELARVYPADLCARMERFYAERRAA